MEMDGSGEHLAEAQIKTGNSNVDTTAKGVDEDE